MTRYDEILCDGQLKTQAMVRAVVRGAYLTVSLQISCGRSEIMSFGAISPQWVSCGQPVTTEPSQLSYVSPAWRKIMSIEA